MALSSLINRFIKVLIVEDDVKLRQALVERCKGEGYKVFEASEAGGVLTLVATEKPDVIVLDLILPAKDGISLLEELRESGFTMPVIILSNLLGSGNLRSDAERLGAQFYNKSSTSLQEVVDAIKRVL